MKKLVLALCAFMFVTNAYAASKSELNSVINRINNELSYYDQSGETLDRAKEKLEDALAILRGSERPPVNNQPCFDYAYGEIKADGYSNASSLEKAKDVCIKMNDQNTTLNLLTFFYGKIHRDGYSAISSFNYALNFSLGLTEDQINNCLDTAFTRYKLDGYSVKTSLEKAANYCRR